MSYPDEPRIPSPSGRGVVKKSCLVIGGGIAGLMAATVLQRRGITVTVLDKGKGIGGRLATRRIRHPIAGAGVFDYGAQSFTVSHPRFQSWVAAWLEQGVVQAWSQGFYDDSGQIRSPSIAHYRGTNSNRSIAQYLAQELTVHTQTRVTQLHWESDQWTVTAGDRTFQADTLILTPPMPQSLALLHQANLTLPAELQRQLEQAQYLRCIAVLALLEKSTKIPDPGGLWLDHPRLSWIACNQQKGISAIAPAVTLHASTEFSTTYWESDDASIAQQLLEAAAPWLETAAIDYQVHRWRYSQAQTLIEHPFLALPGAGPLILAGDAFQATSRTEPCASVERAVLSGLLAAEYLLLESVAR